MFKPKTLALTISSLIFCANAMATDLNSDIAKESYSLGASAGKYLSNEIYTQGELGVDTDVSLVIEGIVDALKDQNKMTNEEVITALNSRAEALNKIVAEKQAEITAKNKSDSETFLAENAKKEGVVTLDSGLQYQVLEEGTGRKPNPQDVVTLKYTGTFIDGTVFEKTESEAGDVSALMTLIPGFDEGLRQLKQGSKAKIFIPANLAYGSEGVVGEIPPEAALIFEVELVKVEAPKGHGGMGMGGMGMGGMGGMK